MGTEIFLIVFRPIERKQQVLLMYEAFPRFEGIDHFVVSITETSLRHTGITHENVGTEEILTRQHALFVYEKT